LISFLGTPGRSGQTNNPAGHAKPAFSPSSHGAGGVAVTGSTSRDAAAGSSSWPQADVAADSVRIP